MKYSGLRGRVLPVFGNIAELGVEAQSRHLSVEPDGIYTVCDCFTFTKGQKMSSDSDTPVIVGDCKLRQPEMVGHKIKADTANDFIPGETHIEKSALLAFVKDGIDSGAEFLVELKVTKTDNLSVDSIVDAEG